MASCGIWYFLPRAWERITILLLPSEGGTYLACQNGEAPCRRIISNIIFFALYICYLVPSESHAPILFPRSNNGDESRKGA